MKFSGRERRANGRVRLLGARGSAELRKVASGSATQDLWLRNGKVRSQVSGIDRSRFPGRRTVGEVRRGRVVRASASQSVDLGFIPLVESYQKTLKNGIRSFPAWRLAFMAGCGEQAGKFACCVLGQGT